MGPASSRKPAAAGSAGRIRSALGRVAAMRDNSGRKRGGYRGLSACRGRPTTSIAWLRIAAMAGHLSGPPGSHMLYETMILLAFQPREPQLKWISSGHLAEIKERYR